MKEIILRDYQQECVDLINNLDGGSHLVAVATGLGKTVIFSHIKRHGRMLILSHRDELVHQPQKYFDCSFGVEQSKEVSNGEEVISASVQSLVRRLKRFDPDDFDIIITDEAHHAAAPTYRKIYNYFKARLHIGFTATPNRGDKVRLDDIYEDIIFDRDLKWGIENKYLTDINCLQANIGFDISKVKKKRGDFDLNELGKAVNQAKMNKGVAKAYQELAVGQTIIFAADIAHAYAIANEISGAEVVSSKTKNRAEIIDRFVRGEISCLVNVMVFTEGTDLPMIETIIIARPTANQSLYTQMVGRGLRLSKGKKCLTLIDCVGITGRQKICTAPSLLGIDPTEVPLNKRDKLTGMLSKMETTVEKLMDTPDAWIIDTRSVDLFAAENGYNMHNVNWKKYVDGSLFCTVRSHEQLKLDPMNDVGRTNLYFVRDHCVPELLQKDVPMQIALDYSANWLCLNFGNQRQLWDKDRVLIWGSQKASEAQKELIKKLLSKPKNIKKYNCADYDVSQLSKYEASIIIDRLLSPH